MMFLLDTTNSVSNTQNKFDKNQRHAGNPMKPFNREKFLLYLLGGIFVFQAGIFAIGFSLCANSGGLEACPQLGTRYENTFNVMIATTLALLTGSAVKNLTAKKLEDKVDEQSPGAKTRASYARTDKSES